MRAVDEVASDRAADVVAVLRRTIDASLTDLVSRVPGDREDVVLRSERVAGRLRGVLAAAVGDTSLVSVAATVGAVCDHLRFAEAMEACTLLSVARGQLRGLPRPVVEQPPVVLPAPVRAGG